MLGAVQGARRGARERGNEGAGRQRNKRASGKKARAESLTALPRTWAARGPGGGAGRRGRRLEHSAPQTPPSCAAPPATTVGGLQAKRVGSRLLVMSSTKAATLQVLQTKQDSTHTRSQMLPLKGSSSSPTHPKQIYAVQVVDKCTSSKKGGGHRAAQAHFSTRIQCCTLQCSILILF